MGDVEDYTISRWDETLVRESRDLNLSDPEDRACFRTRIEVGSKAVKVSFLRDLASAFGQPVRGNCARQEAVRALTDGWRSARG